MSEKEKLEALQRLSLYEFLESFDLETNVVIYDKESRDVLYRGCVADVPLRVCSQKNIMPNVKLYEDTLNVTVFEKGE